MRKISGNADIQFAVDDDMTGTTIPPARLSHDGQPGLVRSTGSATQTDAQIDFTTKAKNALPPNSTVTWKGTLTPPARRRLLDLPAGAGHQRRSHASTARRLAATGAFQGGVHGDILQANQDNVVPTPDGLDNVRRAVELDRRAAPDRDQHQHRTPPMRRCRCG